MIRHRRTRLLACLVALTVVVAGASAQDAKRVSASGNPIALVGGTLIDGTGGPLIRNSVVLIRGERIERVGTIANLPVPAAYERVSTEGMSVLPGLWDPHVHLIYAGHPNLLEWLQKHSSQLEADIMPVTAEQFLLSGVTTVRDLGAPIEILNLKKRIDSGQAVGPTIYAAGPFLTDTGFGPHSVAVEGEAAARAATKRLIAAGVNIIKFVNADRMAPGVARAIVEEAHAAGLKATAHGRTDAEIRADLVAGVDELQHIGTQSPEYPADIVAAIRDRIRQGPPLSWSPTVGPDLNADELAANPEFLDDPRNYRGLSAAVAAEVREAVAKAPSRTPAPQTVMIVQRKVAQLRELGVELVFGSDEGTFGAPAPQATWRELDAWVRGLGIDPMTAIRKATLDAARHVGADRDSGSVAEGKFADVIAVAGNPLRHIDVLRDPAIVIKHGRRYK
jgi:imidazolonepropionase-like amidohydrolase